jgi:hypothetical protein
MKFLRLWPALLGLSYAARPAWVLAQQVSPFRTAQTEFKDNAGNLNYVAPLQALHSLAANKARVDPDAYAQALATYNSFIGNVSSPAPSTASGPGAYQLVSPLPLIVSHAQAATVVIINEHHNQPGHRAFCQALLTELAPLGYRYFAVEALNPADTAINTRLFPIAASGFYTCEPTMGRLLRVAGAAGFQVIGHELTEAQEKEIADWRQRSNYRDSMQAVNILTVIRQHPQARLVALVGHDHVLEKEREGLKRMATYLRELGHLDPLTIDQTTPYWGAGPTPTEPRVLTKDGHTPVTTGFNGQLVDLQVIHPAKPSLLNGRPAWLASEAAGKPITAKIPAPFAGTQCLAQLYDAAEYKQYGDRAIPLDQYLVAARQKQVFLYALFPRQKVLVRYRPAELP